MLIQIFVVLQLFHSAKSVSHIIATGTVINNNGFPLIGMIASLYQDSVKISSIQTLQDGTYNIQISTNTPIFPQQTIFQIEICYLSSTGLPCQKQTINMKEDQENVYKSQETITIWEEYATIDSKIDLCRILATTFELQSQILQKTITEFSFEYFKNNVKQIVPITAISKNDGTQNFNIFMEKYIQTSSFVLKYTSKHENYWNQHQNSDEYILNAQNFYKVQINIFFTKGHLKYTVKGILKQDLPLSPLQGELKIKLITISTSENIGEANVMTDKNGLFEREFDILLWNKIFVEIEVLKQKFEPFTKQIPQLFDSDQPSITKYQMDAGDIIMTRIRDLSIVGKVIGVTGQAVPNLKLKIEFFTKIKKEFDTTTDSNGQYKIIDIEIHEKELITIVVEYQNVFNKQIITKEIFTTTSEPSQQHKIPDIYYQQLTKVHLKGTIMGRNVPVITEETVNIICDSVDQNDKPISTSITTIKQSFEFATQLLVQEDKIIKCTIVNSQQSKLKPFSAIAEIKAPNYKAEITIMVEYINTQLQIQGVITDETKYTDFVVNANIELNQNSQVLAKTITNAQGSFSIKIPIELYSKLIFAVKISSQNFTPITTPPVSILIDVQNKVYELNKALDRNRIQIAIKDTLQNAQSQPFTKAQVTLLKSDPMIKGSTYYNEKVQTDAQGALNAKFSCYENVDFIATFQIDIESYLPYSLATPKSKCQNLDMGISKISPKKQEVLLDISGKVIDPLMKPKQNLKMTLLIVPTPTNFTLTQLESNVKGEWTKMGVKLDAESKYTISVSYLDGVNEQIKIDFVYTTTLSPKQSLVYQDINFKDLETITIHGNIPTVQGLIPVKIPLNVVCQCEGKDKHSPTRANILTNVDNTYKVQIQCVAQSNVPIQCKFSKGDTTLINQFTQDVSTSSPNWNTEQNLRIEYVKYSTTFEGRVVDPYGKGKSDFELLFTTEPQSKHQITRSKLDGVWQIQDALFQKQQYEGIVTYVDIQNILQQKKNKFTLEANNQKIQFGQILYQDFVKAHLNGQIELKGCKLRDEITLQISCPTTMNRDGIIQNNLKTETSGKIDYQFEILAAYKDKVICTLKTINTFTIDPVAVVFMQPDYAANVTLATLTLFKSLIVDYTLQDEQGKKVENAVIYVVLSPKIPCESVVECKTTASGECKINVNMVNQQKYVVIIKVEHPDFKEYSTNPLSLTFDKDQILSGTFTLQRLVVTTIVHSQVVDKNQNPIPSPIIKFINLAPDVTTNDNKNKQVQANEKGYFDLSLNCYKNLHETLEIDVIFDVQSNIVKGLEFLCSGKQEILPNIQITYVPAKVQVQGQFINPWGKGQANLDLTLSTTPMTKINQFKTDNEGKWNVLLFLQINVKYQLVINYLDYQKQQQVVTTDYQTKSELNQAFNFPVIYYENEVPIQISGHVKSTLGFNVTYNDIYLSDQDGQISKQQTNLLGEYIFKFTKTMKFNDLIQVSIKTAQSSKFLSGMVDFKIVAPKFNIFKNIKVDETKKFKDLIRNYYKQVDVTGIVVSDYNCKGNETQSNERNQPVEKAIITLRKIEADGSDLTLGKVKSNISGYFMIRVYIPKKQLSSPVFISIQKQNFRSSQVQAIIPYLYDMKIEDTITQTSVIKIDLGYQLISLIDSDLPCPFANE